MRLEFPEPGEPAEFSAVVFSSDGTPERHVDYSGVNRFDIGPLTAGRKGVLVFSQKGGLAPVTGTAVLTENEDADILLRPGKSFSVDGVVVDASGRGVPGVDVEFSVFLPLEQRYLPEGFTPFGGFAGGAGRWSSATKRTRHQGFSVTATATGFHLTQRWDTGEEGEFQLRLYSPEAGVTLRLRRGAQLLKEETVLPSRSPFRLVVPSADDLPK